MTKIYTRKGDRGTTSTLAAARLSKADARIRTLGGLDETNAVLGAALAQGSLPPGMRGFVERIQNMLFEAGASVAAADPSPTSALFVEETAWLEAEIDAMDAQLPPLTRFILPGGSSAAAALHWARAVVRRAESFAAEAFAADEARQPFLAWLNRLSDALFVAARSANQRQGIEDVHWVSRIAKGGRETRGPETDR